MNSMPYHLKRFLPILFALILPLLISPLLADYLFNGDMKDGTSGWQGDGEQAFLKADGTEGADSDPGVTPVIKLKLSREHPRLVSQEFDLRDNPTSLHVKVDIFASSDFERSSSPQDYTKTWEKGSYSWTGIVIPSCDFWIRIGPGWSYKLAQATPGSWTTVTENLDDIERVPSRVICFCVPCGQGTLYLKNASVVP
ncbi:MAG: hypothetical protein LV481_08250 [Methylacidiphilales bacterium]|nr:hypothetical protein [Candidatus Methylacidiphilales bacterium]